MKHPAPRPAAGQVLVKITASALNFADLLMIKGTYQDTPTLPFTPGLECAGEIVELGSNISNFEIGDRVALFSDSGGLAEVGAFDATRVLRIPNGVSDVQAAASLIAYGTSLIALQNLAQIRVGETLLVTGAAGGVGLTAVEIGKLLGARVIAYARGADKLAVAKAAGADHLIDASEDLRETVQALGGADVVYEAVGGEVWNAAFRATNPCGRLLPIGFAGGTVPQVPANHLLVKNLTVIGFYLGGYMKARPSETRETLARILDWVAKGKLTPHISHQLPLTQVEQGLELLRNRTATGKVVILPQDHDDLPTE